MTRHRFLSLACTAVILLVGFFSSSHAQSRFTPPASPRLDFQLEGPAIWRGGCNSEETNSINNLFLDTECGSNHVAIRSTAIPGRLPLSPRAADCRRKSKFNPKLDGPKPVMVHFRFSQAQRKLI
jgi:hypothetical protein